jgi:hypothetical protein
MLKIGSVLVNEELVQVVNFDPLAPMGPALMIFLSGQLVTFVGPDVAEAWNVLQAETGFVLVGKTQGNWLVNSDQVGFASIQGSQFVFRIQGRDYAFNDPGDFDFAQLQSPSSAVSADKVLWSEAQPVDWSAVRGSE